MLSQLGEKVAYNLRHDLFSNILRQDIAFFDQQRTGEIINRCVQKNRNSRIFGLLGW